jgi:hypothetical protein
MVRGGSCGWLRPRPPLPARTVIPADSGRRVAKATWRRLAPGPGPHREDQLPVYGAGHPAPATQPDPASLRQGIHVLGSGQALICGRRSRHLHLRGLAPGDPVAVTCHVPIRFSLPRCVTPVPDGRWRTWPPLRSRRARGTLCSASRASGCAFPQRPGRQHRPREPYRPPPSAACPGPWPSYSVMSHRATIRSNAGCGSRRVTRTGGRVRPAARLAAPAGARPGHLAGTARSQPGSPRGRRIVNW